MHQSCDRSLRVYLRKKVSDTFYTTLTDALPAILLEGMQTYSIAYHCETNDIILKLVANFKNKIIMHMFEILIN